MDCFGVGGRVEFFGSFPTKLNGAAHPPPELASRWPWRRGVCPKLCFSARRPSVHTLEPGLLQVGGAPLYGWGVPSGRVTRTPVYGSWFWGPGQGWAQGTGKPEASKSCPTNEAARGGHIAEGLSVLCHLPGDGGAGQGAS